MNTPVKQLMSLTGHIKILYASNLSCSTLLPLLQWREAIRNSKARREVGISVVRVRDVCHDCSSASSMQCLSDSPDSPMSDKSVLECAVVSESPKENEMPTTFSLERQRRFDDMRTFRS